MTSTKCVGRREGLAPAVFYPEALLGFAVGQCGTCGTLMLKGQLLGEIVADLFPQRRDEIDPGRLLRALSVHLRHPYALDCPVCWNRREADNRRVTDGLSMTAMLCEQAANDAELLYLTPTYQEAERVQRERLDRLISEEALRADAHG